MNLVGKRVQVYFNLHKKVYSVRDKKTRKVIAHLNKISLEDVNFKVSQSGRKRVLAEKCKNVHAVVEGTILAYNTFCKEMRMVTYNPYKNDSFVLKQDNKPVYKANKCYMLVTNEKKPRVLATM
jgi:hypothetical protein